MAGRIYGREWALGWHDLPPACLRQLIEELSSCLIGRRGSSECAVLGQGDSASSPQVSGDLLPRLVGPAGDVRLASVGIRFKQYWAVGLR